MDDAIAEAACHHLLRNDLPCSLYMLGTQATRICTGGNGGPGGTTASSTTAVATLPSPPLLSRSQLPAALEAIIINVLYGEPQGMIGTSSGDATCELLGLDKVGDTAPPDVWNGPQELLGTSTGINLGKLVREQALPHVISRVTCGNPSKGQHDLWPDLR